MHHQSHGILIKTALGIAMTTCVLSGCATQQKMNAQSETQSSSILVETSSTSSSANSLDSVAMPAPVHSSTSYSSKSNRVSMVRAAPPRPNSAQVRSNPFSNFGNGTESSGSVAQDREKYQKIQ